MVVERINYIIDKSIEGKTFYIGYPVNLPGIIMQAESIDELKKKIKSGMRGWIEMMQETISLDEPFELKELDSEEWHKLHN